MVLECTVIRTRKAVPNVFKKINNKYPNAKSNIFSRCKFCGDGLKVLGVCQKCGMFEICSVCKKIIQPDKTGRRMGFDKKTELRTDGFCKECFAEEKKKVLNGEYED